MTVYLLCLAIFAVFVARAWGKPKHIMHHLVLLIGLVLLVLGFVLVQAATTAGGVLFSLLLTFAVLCAVITFFAQKLGDMS